MILEPAVLGAPSAIGLVPHDNGEPRRVDLAPAALRAQQVVPRLRAAELGDVDAPQTYRDVERPAGRIRNDEDLATFSYAVADRVGSVLRQRRFVLLLGGDCSIVLGALLAARGVTEAQPGLIYIDAHADFATLDESPSGSACSMALALAMGREALPLARLANSRPLTSGDYVAHIGRRENSDYGADALEQYGIRDLPRAAIDANEALDHMPGPFWIHFDVDVLNPAVFPATGDPAPGGIDFDEAVDLLTPIVHHPHALGMQVTLYDPTLDDDDATAARGLVTMLARVVMRSRG